MTRMVDLGDAVVDTFPVWEPDGVTKKSGESAFTTTIWRDGIEVVLASTITEIGATGEYKFEFTPDVAGVFAVEVIAAYSGDAFGAEYDVRKPELAFGLSAADDGTTADFAVWAELRGERVTALDTVAAVVRTPDGAEVVDLGTDAADTADGIFAFSTASGNIPTGAEYYLDVTATSSGVSWYANLGFAKV